MYNPRGLGRKVVCKRGITSVQTLEKITYVITNEQPYKITKAGPQTGPFLYVINDDKTTGTNTRYPIVKHTKLQTAAAHIVSNSQMTDQRTYPNGISNRLSNEQEHKRKTRF